MKNTKRWSLLIRLAEIVLLITAVIVVVKLFPDMRTPPGGSETSQAASPGSASPETEGFTEPVRPGESAEAESPDDGQAGGAGGAGQVRPGAGGAGQGRPGDADSGGGVVEETEAPYKPPTMIVASDLHYMSPTMTDFGKVLEDYTAGSDGKVLPYLDEITDAFLAEVMEQKPSVLILSGDISQDGEKVNHGELARKLRRVQKAGIQVLVIPGNHDINNPWAATFYGDEMVPTETVDADGFYDIYHEFGYDQAADRDVNSLSYLYKLDDRYWMMMLDSCIYFPENEVGGRIRQDTLSWMEEWLSQARQEQVTVIPVGHHNLLNQSTRYPEDCTLENHREVTKLLEEYSIPIYISGHLHLQRIKKNVNGPTSEGQYGIHEVVSSSLSIPPCQYGVLDFTEDGSLNYTTKTVDVAAWAENQGREEEDLLNFAEYSSRFLVDVISSQLYRSVYSIPAERKDAMAEIYGYVNSAYCGGRKINAREIKADNNYFYWERYLGSTKWFDNLSAMLKDTGHDNNSLKLKAGEDFPAVVREEETVVSGGGS